MGRDDYLRRDIEVPLRTVYTTALVEMRTGVLVDTAPEPGWVEARFAELFLPMDVLLPPGTLCTIESGGDTIVREENSSAVNKFFPHLDVLSASPTRPFIVRLKGLALMGSSVYVAGRFLR